ncbi:MAG: DUF5916 domain-containing protein [Bacteroidota bacterium]
MRRFLLCLALLTALAGVNPAAAQSRAPVELARLASPITLDGKIDEAAWESIAPLPLVMYKPTYRGEMTEATEIRVAYDDTHLYVAGHLYHEDLSNLRANSYYRDRWSGDETFAIILDTFNDDENALWFYTTPLGTRFDMAVANDAEGGRGSLNSDWNTFWDVATTQTEEGWFAEMRIPFTSLGFEDQDGVVEMGMIAYRWTAHNNHRYIYPDIPPNWDRGHAKPSVAQDVILRGVRGRSPLYVAPYGLAGLQRSTPDAVTSTQDRTTEVGLDVKYPLTSNLTLDLTLNTDFAQVEADDQQINLTRFSLFFPEKRPFFQERAGTFEFDTGVEGSRLFNSRQIGLVDEQGTVQPVRLFGGGRLVGRVGDWDVGALNLQTGASETTPSENIGVARVRRRVLNALSSVGGMATTRVGTDGTADVAYGLDGIVNVSGDAFLTLKWAQTINETAADGPSWDPLETGRAMVRWEQRNIQGLSYTLEAVHSGQDYAPSLGFVRRRGVTFLSPDVNYQRFLSEDSRFMRTWVGVWSNVYVRHEDRQLESVSVYPFAYIQWKNGATGVVASQHRYEDVLDDFALAGEVTVPAGRYEFHEARAEVTPPDAWFMRPQAYVYTGTFYDGWKTTAGMGMTWNVSRHLELGPEYEVNVLRFGARDQAVTTHLARVRVQGALDAHLSAAALVQYNSVASAFNINARMRYNVREGHDLWLVYDEGLNTDRVRPDEPRLPLSARRAVLLKYTHTFLW